MLKSLKEITQLIQNGESQYVEFKTSFGKEVIESVVAFSNAYGGKIFIGIDDSAKIVGTTIGEETIQNHINTIKQNTQPNILVDIDLVTIEDKAILIIDIQEYPIKPVAYKNRYYKRIKNSNHLMSLDEISNDYPKSDRINPFYVPQNVVCSDSVSLGEL